MNIEELPGLIKNENRSNMLGGHQITDTMEKPWIKCSRNSVHEEKTIVLGTWLD
jgi:hypothetical protein